MKPLAQGYLPRRQHRRQESRPSSPQLCINYANEKLQQLFNAHTFKQEEECYKEEGVEYVHVDFIDNQPVLSLLEAARPPGIFKMLDDEVRAARAVTYIPTHGFRARGAHVRAMHKCARCICTHGLCSM